MSWTLAITGKGGAGKTTLAALAVRWLGECRKGPVLAVDADPNSCLDGLLGVEVVCSVGGVREEAKRIAQSGMSAGISKQELLDLKIQESLVESERFDLVAMGRPEGPGCYCYANNVLSSVLKRIADQYPTVVIDNEAGLENLSRRTLQTVDCLLFVTDPSARGLKTARRLHDLALEMKIVADRMGVVLNRVHDEVCLDRARQIFAGTNVEIIGALPEDGELAELDARGEPVFELPSDNPVYVAARTALERIFQARPSAP